MRVSEAPPAKGKLKPRTIDVPLEELPPIDEHAIEIEAPAEAAWDALFPILERSFDRPKARRYAERVGAAVTVAKGDLHHPGGTLPGFTVIRAIATGMATPRGRDPENGHCRRP